jgi:2-methylaconitate cis-trans-isomerase PrpF
MAESTQPNPLKQLRIPAVYMRGGTSKGVFFVAADLPADPPARDRLLLRVLGSPDRYGKQIDGMGGASSSTSKVVIVSPSTRPGHDVDYLFGQVSIDAPVIDWSGNCGNLSAAVGPFAIGAGLAAAPADGLASVRIWQANLGKTIVAHVPMQGGEVLELGGFELDGVAFPAAEVKLEFIAPGGGRMFPSGRRIDLLQVPGLGPVEATLVDAGNPTIFVDAASLGLRGTELQPEVNGRPVQAASIDLLARIFSMGQLHHAMTGTGAVAIAAAAAVPGTLVHRIAPTGPDGRVRLGHPSGCLAVGAEASEADGQWRVDKVLMSRSARRLMEGWVRVPSA